VMSLPVSVGGGHACSHVVEFYESEGFLIDTVSRFVGSALQDGDTAIVIATSAHRQAIRVATDALGIDPSAAVERYLVLDAADLLRTFMVDGEPDAERFQETIRAVIERPVAEGRQMQVFGEMGVLLWDAGDVASTITLEDLWNGLGATYQLAMLCAYPVRVFGNDAQAAVFERICEQHTGVIPGESFPLLDSTDAQQRAVARLQQEGGALRADLARLRAERKITDELADGDALTGLAKRRTSHQLDAAERVARLGTWEWPPGTDTQVWSDNLYSIFGVEPGQISPTRQYVLERTHPEDRDRLAKYIELSALIARPPPIEYRIRQPAGDVRYLRASITNIEIGPEGARRIVGMIQDVSEQRIASRELAAHVAVSAALIDWYSFQDGARHLLNDLGTACEFVVGALWLPQGDVLAAELTWSSSSLNENSGFESMTRALRLPLGANLPGLAWRSKRPETIVDVSDEPGFRRHKVALAAGLHGAVAFPALVGDEVLAVLEFYSRDQDHIDRLRPTLASIGSELGEFFSRRRGELAPARLTPRELQTLQLAALGNAAPQIAESLGISISTVKTHMDNIYRKLDVSDRAAAVATAMRLGVIH
jgi:DNA-binding CsgD family transcriptional regulator/PAS domain-containing protein